jgi:polysaccharide export outer membrane protein
MIWSLTINHRSLRRYGAHVCTLLLVSLLMGSPLPARAEYVSQRGDVLEITVSGAPALTRRVAVNPDGEIVVPLLGEIEAADLPLTELRRRLQDLLTARNVVQHPDVIVSVAEYGPIYVGGDVVRSGEYRYRPEITVRNAIALAGGIDTFQSQARLSSAQIAEARGDFGAAAIEYARQKAQVARLKAELADSEVLEIGDAAEQSVDRAVISEILGIEKSQLKVNRQADVREKAYLQRMISATRDEMTALEQAQAQQESAFTQQSQDAARARELLQKGVGTVARTEDGQRAVEQSRSQLLEVRVRLAQARKELEERTRQLETFDDQRNTKLLKALHDAIAEAGKVRYRLDAARDRMSDGTGAGRQSAVPSSVTIHRTVKGLSTAIAADLDTTLLSGDTIEVAGATIASRETSHRSLASNTSGQTNVSDASSNDGPRPAARP